MLVCVGFLNDASPATVVDSVGQTFLSAVAFQASPIFERHGMPW